MFINVEVGLDTEPITSFTIAGEDVQTVAIIQLYMIMAPFYDDNPK